MAYINGEKIKMKHKDLQMTLAEKMEMVRMSVRAVTREFRTSRLIIGGPGIGKSYSVIQELENEGATYAHITGGVKDAKAFYITLYKHNNPNMIIVLDDVNDILRRRECIEILRACVTNETERSVSYIDNRLILDGVKSYHPHMKFQSRVIIVTNIPKKKIDSAILSRTSPIEVYTTKEEMIEYIGQNIEAAPPSKLPIEWKIEVFNYIKDELKINNIKQIDFRLFEDCMLWKAATVETENPEMWKKYAYNLLT